MSKGFRFPIRLKLQSPIYQKQMYDEVQQVNQDKDGNWWYLNELLRDWNGLMGRGDGNNKVDFDMQKDLHKRLALNVCTPFSMVINRCGSFFSNVKYYVQDKDGNEPTSANAEKIRNLLKKPNILQSGKSFTKQIEVCLKTFGYCPVFTLRAMKSSIPESMVIIPPELFHQKTTGKIWKQTELSEVISKTYIDWNGEQLELEEGDYFVIVDSEMVISSDSNSEITYDYIGDSLTNPVNNWMAQMIARGTLIKHGGPKGIIYSNDNSEFQNAALTEKEKNELNSTFKKKYGIVNKLFSIWVTQKKVGWIPLSFNVDQLKLHEEDKSCMSLISNALGLDPSLFSSDSKYDNKDAAKRSAYQDLILPDSENVAETLTNAICPDGLSIRMDYSHVACLQKDKQAESTTLKNASDSLRELFKDGLISKEEARIKLAEYIDINPKDNIDGK